MDITDDWIVTDDWMSWVSPLLGVLLLGFQLNQPPCSARSRVLVFGIWRSAAGVLVVGGYMAGLGFNRVVVMACLYEAMWVSCVG